MTSKTPSGCHYLSVLTLLLCSGLLFYVYYKPNVSWSVCPDVTVPTRDVCVNTCFDTFLTENLIQNINNTCTLNYTSAKRPTSIKQPPVAEGLHEPDTIVLIWVWPFGHRFNLESCAPVFGIPGCHLTANRSLYDKAHAVMFHHRDIYRALPKLGEMARPPQQKWVWMNMESPHNSARLGRLDLFNLTANYRRDSDIWVPYGRIAEASEKDEAFRIPEKTKLVCWIVSNWNRNFQRVKYFEELSRHIEIEAYGRHFGRYVSGTQYSELVSGCKFYLSFENSIYKDYITEKLYNPMKLGTVPVVLGPPRENYEEFVPADSFIHVNDFKTPQELAEHLKLLDQNREMYEQYFTWRERFAVRVAQFGLEHACRICDHVRRDTGYRVFKSLDKWFWG
ncbi:hypothetical protein NFI96_004055 [Prochilodus magdalenae]|nr:hypothetical protein NFI96_004055 [Prochilodus magdalenae]